MRKTITKRAVDALRPGQIIADDQLPGFVCRCLPSGRLAFGYRFTKDGRRRWIAIGVGIAPEAARKAAAAHAGRVAKDETPMTGREHRRRQATRTLNQGLDVWLKERVVGRGLRSAAEIVSLLARYVRPRLGQRMVEGIKRLDMVELLDWVAAAASARTSDKVLSTMGTFFRWYALRDDEFRSPIVPGMARLTLKDLSRDRVLADDEIRTLWAALESCQPEAYARIVRALLLSACRLNEIARLSRPEIDGDVAVIPAQRVKTKTEHALPITPGLADLIGTQGDGEGDYLFSTDGGFSPFSGFSKAKRRLDELVAAQRKKAGLRPMPPWQLHDLRRTARSLMSRAGVAADVAERVLGHVMPGVRGVYDRHEYLAEKRDALRRLEGLLASIINPPAAKVVPLRVRR
jgi:integrase